MSNEISALLREIEKKLDLRVGPLSGVAEEVKALTTGNLAIDYITGVGGLPLGRSTELIGPPACGKTSVALQTAAELQKTIIAEGREEFILYSDFEHALDKEYATNLGLDVEHPSFLLMQPDSMEQGVNAALLLLDTDRVRLSIWDSVASMTPDSMSNSEFSSRPMEAAHKAKLMSDFIRVLNAKLHRYSCSAVFLNHIMDVIETGFAPRGIKRTTTPGGKALKYYASVRIEFQQISTIKAKAINALTNESVDRVEATNVKVKVVKNKVGSPFRECVVRVRLGKGFDNFWSAVQVLLAYKKITAGGGGYYYFDALPELKHDSMERSSKGRVTLRSERALLEFAERNPDWASLVVSSAKSLLPTSSLPTDEELLVLANNTAEDVTEFSPLDLNEFGDAEVSEAPAKLGLIDLNDFSVSP